MRNLYYDELPDLPDPPSRETDIDTHRIHRLQNELCRAHQEPHDAAYFVSHALYLLQCCTQKRHHARPGAVQRDALLAHLARTHGPIMRLFTAPDDREIAATAYDATVLLICHWAASDTERSARSRQAISDAHQWVRWLRNACHNFSILGRLR